MQQLYEIYKAMDKLCGTRLLTEGQAEKSKKQAKDLYMQRTGCTREEAEDFVRNKLQFNIPALRSKNGGKFILGATRMFLDNQLYDAQTIGAFNSTIQHVVNKGYTDKFEKDLDGLSAQEFIAQFQQERQADFDNESEKLNNIYGNNTDISKSGYEKVEINEFEDAEMYADYCDWCITHSEDAFNSYGCDGVNQIYFCLKNGFEDVPKEQGEGFPLDEYGLSMISVIVNPNGSLAWCTCRWNHDGGNDHIMSMADISKLVGCSFTNVFKPNNKFANAVQEAQQQLANGEHPRDVFDSVGPFYGGWAAVELNRKCNFVNRQRQLLSDTWFDDVCDFTNGYAEVRLNGKRNYINTEGKLISDTWFDGVGYFLDGYASVQLNDKWNFINTEGQVLSKQWFDWLSAFSYGYAKVYLNKKWNWINTEGQLVSEQWFDIISVFINGWSRVSLNNKENYINTEGQLISDTWFDNALGFYKGFADVKLNGKRYKIDTKGNLYDFDTCEPIR